MLTIQQLVVLAKTYQHHHVYDTLHARSVGLRSRECLRTARSGEPNALPRQSKPQLRWPTSTLSHVGNMAASGCTCTFLHRSVPDQICPNLLQCRYVKGRFVIRSLRAQKQRIFRCAFSAGGLVLPQLTEGSELDETYAVVWVCNPGTCALDILTNVTESHALHQVYHSRLVFVCCSLQVCARMRSRKCFRTDFAACAYVILAVARGWHLLELFWLVRSPCWRLTAT